MTVNNETEKIKSQTLEDLYQLSPMQEGMLFQTLYSPGSGIYFEQSISTIEGDFDRSAFQSAWQKVIARHSILRTAFAWEGLEKPVQIVYRNVTVDIEEHDWRGWGAGQQHEMLETVIGEDQKRGFDLTRPPLLRLKLFRVADTVYKFLWSRHHLILDRWSRALVLKDFFNFYEAFCKDIEPQIEETRPYGAYIEWLLRQDQSAAEFFWRRSLQGFENPTEIRLGKTSSLERETYEQESVRLSSEATGSLRRFAREQKLTMYTLVQGAWSLLLSRYSGERDLLFGATVAGRPADLAHVENMVGLFINTLPVRVTIQPQTPLVSWLRQLQERQVEQRQYEYSSLIDIQGWSDVPRGVPLFETILVFENLPVETSFRETKKSLVIRGDRGMGSRTNYPLTIIVNPGTELAVQAVYDSGRFEADSITRLLNHFLVLLEQFSHAAEHSVSQISLLDALERDQLLRQWNETSSPFPDQCIHQLFEAKAEQEGAAVAVRYGSEELSYAELNARANQLANYLRGRGVGPEARVAICVERSVDMIVGLLGILKAGGAYVPLEPSYPRERISFVLADCQPRMLLTQKRLRDQLPTTAVETLYLDGQTAPLMDERIDNPVVLTCPENSAHVIYTSGSTGQPKGVVGTHRASLNRFAWMWRTYPFAAEEVCCQKTSLSFVDSIWEIFGPLLQGVPLVITPDEMVKDPREFLEALAAEKVTRLVLVPSLLRAILETGQDLSRKLVNLRYCVCSGETLTVELATMFRQQLPRAKLINLYGSSEVAADVTYFEVDSTDKLTTIPIGRPIANTEVYILDRDFQAVPVGVFGEIFVGGQGLARCYLNRSELTAEKFVPHPFGRQAGARLFRTGDMGRYLPDGTVEYRGRCDHQVKIRGFRIEPGEIEAHLADHPQVNQAVVVANENQRGEIRLVAYLVLEPKQTITIDQLRTHLQQRLPDHMIPSAFVLRDALPLTVSGKVDRRQLSVPDPGRPELAKSYVAPRTPIEQEVARIWEQVLKVKGVGVNDNFFELGGHSLLAVSMISRVREALSVDLKVRSLFEAPTVARLARTLDQSGKHASVPPITRVERGRYLPLSFAQERLWFLDQLESESPFYNVPSAFRLTGALDVESLRKAFEAITMRHEALRTTFSVIDGKPVQVIAETPAVTFSFSDLGNLARDLIEDEIRQRGGDEARTPFDLQKGPLLRVKLLRLAETEYVLLITTHHIVSDGWSIGILARELAALYEEFAFGRPAHLPKLLVQYVDYAIWQREWLHSDLLEKQVSYWKRQLHGAPALLELPKDRPRPAVQTFNGARRSARLSQTLTKALNDLSRREGVTLFMTLLAVYQTLLWRYSGQSDVVVGTPVAGRNTAELEGLIGFFVNTLVMRSDLSANPSFRQLLSKVRETALEAYAHQDLPFERLVDAMQPERSLSHTPLFQVALVFQNAPREGFNLGGLNLHRIPAESRTSKFDLTLFATEAEESLNLAFEYNTDLFDDARIERMLQHLQKLIEGVVREPTTRIGRLEILPEPERTQLLFEWNETGAGSGKDCCLHEWFEEQAEERGSEIALVWGTEQLSYGELNRRANQLAQYLKQRGVGPEVLVGVCVKRGWEMVVGILGILKAGGAYVPLDPEYPEERLRFMLEDAKARLLLTQEGLLAQLPETAAEVVCLDRDWEEISKESEADARAGVGAGNLAYVIYTSGTTGQPKGVAIEHRSAVALVGWAREVFRAEELSGVLAATSICFDLSVFELFVPLSTGGKVVVADDVLQLLTLGAAREVKLINTVPSAMVELLRLGGLPESVETVNLAGEPLAASLVEQLYERAHIRRVYDLYGPTEDTTYSTYALRVAGAHATIGRPIANTRTYLLDRRGQPVPIGVPGEIYLGGAGLARGYLQRPELTAQVFVPDPFSGEGGARLYKTGDLGRYLEDGSIEYLGRFDNQVKLRGFRIELAEIEGVIKKHPQVSEVIVLSREDEPGDKRLVAYVVPNRDASDLELKQKLQVEQVSEWQAVWNETYVARSQDPTFNIVGWNNSYTGEPIPSEEMRQWVNYTVDRILSLRPSRVLEVGCGTGLLLFRIAPRCTYYHGTDISKTALDCLRQHLSGTQAELQNITLTEQTADDFGGIEAQAFDTVILNSVVQYFPSVDYLVRVLEDAAKCVKPGGTIFLGDVRNLALLKALHTSVQLHQAPSDLPLSEMRRRVQKRIAEEKELAIDPAFFTALQRQLPQISRVQIQLKRGAYQNELNKFRYDVVLHVEGDPVRCVDQTWLDWRLDQLNINKARQLLMETAPDIVAIRGVPNARLASDCKALTLLGSEAVLQTAGELREDVQRSNDEPGVDPEEFYALVKDLPYSVDLTWAELAGDGTFDVVLRRRSAPYAEVIREQSRTLAGAWGKYANDPLLGKVAQSLEPALRTLLLNQLPEYMTPSEFVFLNVFPLTPNGKIDRLALPEPGQSRPELEQRYVAPRTEIEKELAGIWARVLGRETVGIKDNFFELGGHSLLATQVVSRIREQFKLELPLRSIFESPTIIDLASVVAELQQKTKRAAGPELKRRRPGAKVDHLTLEEVDSLLSKVLSNADLTQ